MSLLELGSGIGLFGLTAAKLGHSVTFTDSHPMVLDFIKANIRINLDAVRCCSARMIIGGALALRGCPIPFFSAGGHR